MSHDRRSVSVSVPRGHPAVASSCPRASGSAPPLPPPRNPGGRRAERNLGQTELCVGLQLMKQLHAVHLLTHRRKANENI